MITFMKLSTFKIHNGAKMKLYLFIFTFLTTTTACTSLYYDTLVQVLLYQNTFQLSHTQEQNIETIAQEIQIEPSLLYPNISLNTTNKEKIRCYLTKYDLLIRQLIHNVKHQDQLQDITWAFVALYIKSPLKKHQYSSLFIDAQDMYNIFYHLYNYSHRIQSKF